MILKSISGRVYEISKVSDPAGGINSALHKLSSMAVGAIASLCIFTNKSLPMLVFVSYYIMGFS